MKLYLSNITKSYHNLKVLSDITMEFSSPQIYCLMAPSGSGKTTLFRLILGLEQPEHGKIYFEDEKKVLVSRHDVVCSSVFQEDRLFEHLSPVENLSLILGETFGHDRLLKEMLTLLPSDCLTRPVFTLSGGMKRRLALLRAVLFPSDILILDEPFSGLDEATKNMAISYLLSHQNNRLTILSTHDPEDVRKLNAKLINL